MSYNKSMKKGRLKKGFTIIEVAIFLAISGALFVMVIANTAARVAGRRYFDAVNDLAEELRNAYSATVNVENYRSNTEDSGFFCSITSAFDGVSLTPNTSTTDIKIKTDNYPGRTRCAVYGQVITFGEDNRTEVHRYDIIGLAKNDNIEPNSKDKDEVLDALADAQSTNHKAAGVKANIVTIRNKGNNTALCSAAPAGNNYAYLPQWNATIENKKSHDLYHGAVMIVRSPITGTIHTYIYSAKNNPEEDNPINDDTFYVQEFLRNSGTKGCVEFSGDSDRFIKKAIDDNHWFATKPDGTETHLDICVGGEDSSDLNEKRRAIRIHGDGSTEAAIEVLSEADSNGVCKI